MSPAVTIKEQRSQVKSWPEALGQQWASVSLEESILSQQTSNSHKMGRFCVRRKTDSKQKNKQKNEFTVLLYVQYDLHLTLIKCFYYTCLCNEKKRRSVRQKKRRTCLRTAKVNCVWVWETWALGLWDPPLLGPSRASKDISPTSTSRKGGFVRFN